MFNLHAHQRFHLGCDPSSRELEEQAIRAFAWNDINRHDRLGIAIFHADVFRIQGDRRQLGCYNQHPDLYPLLHPHLHGIYNIEATHANRRKFHFVCSVIYIAIIAIFALSSYLNQGLYIGKWLYVMLALYFGNVVYCIYMIVQEMIKRKNMLETMAASDMLPYVRYARSSVVILFLAALIMPFAILSNTLLFIAGPFGLLALLFFNLNFVALGSSYTPTEELLDKEEEQEEAIKANAKRKKAKSEEKTEESNDNEMDDIDNTPQLPEERRKFIQESLDRWCAKMGYKDSAANMLTLSSTLHISKNELSIYFDQCLKSTFRIWLSEIRFNAAKQMMTECPDYSNDIISAECGFSSRTHLYRVFKAKEGCTPTVWREIHS